MFHTSRAWLASFCKHTAACTFVVACTLAASVTQAQESGGQYPVTQYPTTGFSATQLSTEQYPSTQFAVTQVAYAQPNPVQSNSYNNPLVPSQLDFGDTYTNYGQPGQSSIETLPPGTVTSGWGTSGANKQSWIAPPNGAAPCVTCNPSQCSDVWHSQVIPQGIIYQSYMAGAKEPRMGSFWNQNDVEGTRWDIALGGRAGLYRYGNDNPDWPEGFQVDMEGAVFPRLDPLGESTPLLSSDYRFGIPVTYGKGQWQYKVAYYHISSHLGDELMLMDPSVPRLNFVRDGIAFGIGYFFTPSFRVYGEYGYSPSSTGGAEASEFQFGFDWAQARNTGLRGGPFMAMNANLREEVDFGGNFVAQAGWMWRKYARGPNARIGVEYFYGKSDQFEFWQQTESRIGWGIWYDF